MIEALAADRVPVAEAIRSAEMPQADYDPGASNTTGLDEASGRSCARRQAPETKRRPNRNHPGKPPVIRHQQSRRDSGFQC